MNKEVRGTKGYIEVSDHFVNSVTSINFTELHQPFIKFIPDSPAMILDVGAGIGRDASYLAQMGYSVVAVEPVDKFISEGRKLYNSPNIEWVRDSLPLLTSLNKHDNQFAFILASAVWHHLDCQEQESAMRRIFNLLIPGGVFAVSLRHGPAGVGIQIFPTYGEQTISYATSYGLKQLLYLSNQPSLLKGKKHVTWTKLVFQKTL